jgi:gliding motility-associated-like protein
LGTLNCPAVDYFRVVIGLDPMANINQCNYLLPEPEIGTYWDDQHLPDGTCNDCTQLFPGDYVEQSGIIYLYVAPPPGEVCASGQNQISFTVNVTQPLVDDIPNFVTPNCGPFTLTAITNGKYYTESHLSGGTGGTEITLPYIVETNQTIYVYNVNPGSGPVCEYEKSFEFVINPLPPLQVDYRLDVDLCSGDFTAGVLPFYTLDIPTDGNLYTLPNGGGNLLISPDDRKIEGPFPVDIYLYNIFPDTGCKSERVIRITYSETLVDTVPSEFPIEVGVTYTLQPLITPNAVYHDNYWNPTDPTDLQNPNPLIEPNIIPPGDYTMPDPTQDVFDTTFYIYNASFDGVRPVCPVNKSFRVLLYRQPDIYSPRSPGVYEMPNVYVCGGGYVLPPLVGSQKYYKESHSNPGPYTEIPVGTSISEDMFVYIYEENNSIIPGSTFKLTDEERFFVDVFNVDTVVGLSGCGSVTLPNLTSGSYYHESDTGHTNPITNLTIVNNGTTIITEKLSIFGLSGFPSTECQSLETFVDISITPSPIITPIPLYDADPLVIDRTYCDTDDTNDGILNIDLTLYNSTLLGTQTSSEFSVTYHASENDALTNANPILESLSNNPSLYAVVRNSNFAGCSSDPLKIDFVVNPLPKPNPQDVYLCINNSTGLPISAEILDSGLLLGNYIFEWKDSSGTVVGGSNTYVANTLGDYTLTVTDIDPTKGCVSEVKTVSVLPSSIAITGYTVTQDFSDNQIITVIPDGYGDNYVYQLDGSLFQESNVFTNVPSGNHEIVIRDKNGCGDSNPINVLVLQYPKFFTPNSDGYNDYWNIYDLQELGDPNAKISIFDRQGKLIKQISPYGQGWDGMHNGNPLYADDYWFVVNYTREGISREFKSHFSIKR